MKSTKSRQSSNITDRILSSFILEEIPLDILNVIISKLDIYDALMLLKSLNVDTTNSTYIQKYSLDKVELRELNYNKVLEIPKECLKYTELIISDFRLSELDIIRNVKSLKVYRYYGPPANYQVGHLPHSPHIERLYISYNAPFIDIIQWIQLKVLHCVGTNITDISSLTNLEELNCQNTFIDDISKNVKLKILNCSYSNIRDVSMLLDLIELKCDYGPITDISMLTKLIYLSCKNCRFTNSNINSLNLITLICSSTNITYVNNLIYLTYLDCSYSLVDNVDNLLRLRTLICISTKIIMINHLVNINVLDISFCDIQYIFNLKELTTLSINGNKYITNISYLNKLTKLHCVNARLTDVSNIKTLSYISTTNPKLKYKGKKYKISSYT
jgi:hypothetical protein